MEHYHELCVEWDEDAASTLVAAGFPGVCGDVRDMKHYDGLKHVDMIWASPPCQAFSTAGSRQGALDDRNGWPWTLDVIDHLRSRGVGPEWVVCENVMGMTYHRGDCDRSDAMRCPGCYWNDWIQPEFKKRFDWVGVAVINAADFGVPQHRRRVFLVGGPRPVRWPEPTHCRVEKIDQQVMFGPRLKPWVSIREALGIDATIIGGGTNPRKSSEADTRSYRDITNEPSTTVAAVQVGNAGPFVLNDSGAASTTLGTGVPGSEPWRLDKPSPAITSRDWRGARHQKFDPTRGPMTAADATWRAMGRRRLTWRECAALQGFPGSYPFTGRTQASMYKQVGNAVCPKVSEVLGLCVLKAMMQ